MDVPVLVGSGVTINNVHKYKNVDGFIIGSHFKKHGMYVLHYHIISISITIISNNWL